jgi:hypothetical protein
LNDASAKGLIEYGLMKVALLGVPKHWGLAKLAIAQQDGLAAALLSPEQTIPTPEPIEAITNQGEFPTLVDQGEGLSPTEWGKLARKPDD